MNWNAPGRLCMERLDLHNIAAYGRPRDLQPTTSDSRPGTCRRIRGHGSAGLTASKACMSVGTPP